MAEADKLLIAVEFDAKGPIKDVEILDTKFDKLGNTLRKGKARTEGMAAAQKKLADAQKKGVKPSVEQNVAFIGKLAAMEALTSASNQLISAQYKRIDADLAAGKITEEEAERLRKNVKVYEKYTGSLETIIALARFYTVGQMFMTAATTKATMATNANTKAVLRNTAALLLNPWGILAIAIIVVVAAMVDFWHKSGAIRRGLEDLNKIVDAASEKWNNLQDAVSGAIPNIGEGVGVLGAVNITGDTFR